MRIFFSKKFIGRKGFSCRLCLAFMLLAAVMTACEKEDGNKTEPEADYTGINSAIQELLYCTYYWNYKIDSKLISGNSFRKAPKTTEPQEYFASLLYNDKNKMVDPAATDEYDRWSFMSSYSEYEGVMVEGEYKSFGYLLGQALDYSVRVCLVYEGSPMAREGIERGYELVRLNGIDMDALLRMGEDAVNQELNKETGRYVFADRAGNLLKEKTISKAVVKINPVLRKNKYDVNGSKVGYIVYNTFITASKDAITAALREFNDVGDIILDLRYNGGGDVSVADAICEHLLPASVGTDSVPFAKYIFSQRTNEKEIVEIFGLKDEVRKIKRNADALDISRLFVIVSDQTASASEEVINSMKPFVDEVILVGTPTHGKPTGMLVWVYPTEDPQWAIAPISFRIDNKNGEGSYFSGIFPAYTVQDDLYHDFGVDPETLKGEACLQAVMEYVKTGRFPAGAGARSVQENRPGLIRLKGLQIHAGCI
jgi:C-terminal processing protease CtpA/Prc